MPQASSRARSSATLPAASALGGFWRGLVVDDDLASRASAKLALDGEIVFGLPLSVEYAASAAQAREILSADHGYSFAILDVMMESPEAGLALVDWIRSKPELATLRLAIRTGYSGEMRPEEVIQKYDVLDYRFKTELTRGKLIGIVASLVRSFAEISGSMAGERSMAALAQGGQELAEAQNAQFFLLALAKAGREVMEPTPFDARMLAPGEEAMATDLVSAKGLPDIKVSCDARAAWPSQAKALRRLVSAAKAAYAKLASVKRLEAMAYSDQVTGLANRRRLMQWLERDLEVGEPLGVMILDVDHFKKVNDRLGHDAGDRLLKALGERMAKACEAVPARAARLGGDEFCSIFRCADEASAMACSEKWLSLILGPVSVGLEVVEPRFSAGVAWSASGQPGESLRNADVAMYQAKRSGRGRLCVYEPSQIGEAPKRERGARLAKGLADGELSPMFQPLVDASDGSCVAFEIFARWRRGGEALVMPGDFLPMAQEAGVARAIDGWMAAQALQASQSLDGSVQMRINLDSNQACDESFAEELARIWLGSRPGAFAVEILESAALPDLERVRRFATRLRRDGHGVGLDAFGSGNASLGFLSRLPLDGIKLDAALARAPVGAPEELLGRSGAAVAAVHGIECVVIGVESRAEARRAASWGVTSMQGRWIAPPMEWASAQAWLADWRSGAGARWAAALRP